MLNVFDVLSLVVVGIDLGFFLFFYIAVWKIRELPLSHRILYGIIFIPLSLFIFCGILFQGITDYSFAVVLYLLISGQLFLIMISDAGGNTTARKLRFGRMALYSIGYAIRIIAITFLYILIFINIIVLGTVGTIYVDRLVLFGVVGSIIFILSLWGFSKEEKYGTGGKMKGTALTWANVVFLILLLIIIDEGIFSVIDLITFQQYGYYLIVNIGIFPNYNSLAGALYLPIGIVLLILSLRKLRRDYRYRKQFY